MRVLSFIILFIFTALTAVSQKYDFRNYTVENGLGESQVLAISQDDNGRVWLGYNNGGVSIFDGKEFTHLLAEDGLADNIVYDIHNASDDRMLVGTNLGLSVYQDYTFTNYTAEDGLPHERIFTIHEDANGIIWLGTQNGIAQLKGNTISVFETPEAMNEMAVVDIVEDELGRLWFCTLGAGYFVYDGDDFEQVASDLQYGFSAYEIAPGKMWLLTYFGLMEYDGKSVTPVQGAKGMANIPFQHQTANDSTVWFGTGNGVFKYDRITDDWKHFTTDNGLVNNNIYKVFQDREGNLWFGSRDNGLSKLTTERFHLYNTSSGLVHNSVQYVFRATDGRLWLGTKDGISVFDGESFQNYNELNSGQKVGMVWSINETKDGTIWVASDGGLIEIGDNKKEFHTDKEVLEQQYLYDIFIEDIDEQILLGTVAGVAYFKDGVIKDASSKFDLPKVPVFKIARDAKGYLWFATEKGVFYHDGSGMHNLNEERSEFPEGKVRSVIVDDMDNLWFATGEGIIMLDIDRGIHQFSEEQGVSSNTIYSLAFDDGKLWAGVSNGIDQITFDDPARTKIQSVRNFGLEDAFMGQVCNNNAVLVEDDRVFIGTINGLMAYQPRFDNRNKLAPTTLIKDIRLFSLKTDWKEHAESVGLDGIPKDLSLTYNKNYLTFDFIGVSHTSPSKVKYQYKLEGFDNDWIEVEDKNSAVYSNLPPGDYTFKVRSSNGDGVWNDEPTTFSFSISPPFWQTWWFYSLCTALLLAGIFSYLKIRRANVKITQQNFEIKEQRDEIAVQKDVIEEKNNDILDSINYAERIQKAIMPSDDGLQRMLMESFVLYLPKDIISGDFYWVKEKEGKTLFAAVDCTGHGVPGAMVSVVGNNGLNRCVNEIGLRRPAEILDTLSEFVEGTFAESDDDVKDGMDIALCSIDRKQNKLLYAGANNPLYIVRGEEIIQIKADKQPIGSFAEREPFKEHEIDLQEGDMIYVFSDGYADQFGGPSGKKFKYSRFRKFLVEISALPVDQQKEKLYDTFDEWKGNTEQLDDVCVIGVRV